MGRRARAKGRVEKLRAPDAEYRGADGDVLVLRSSMSPLTRHRYDAVRSDQSRTTDDSWQRSVEYLFERLVIRWEISGVVTEGQKDLLARFRFASQEERRWIREILRRHLAEHFPDLKAP
jgi:hypothetical protein